MRQAVQGLLPREILWRKKSPYPKTYDPKYLELVNAKLNELLADPAATIHSLVDRKALVSLATEDSQWPWYGQLMQRPQTIAYMLQIDDWLRRYNVDIRL